MKKAFTLIELLVVIAILAILASVLVVSMGGATESARAAKCQANMRTISQACYSIALADEYKRYPHAGSAEYMGVTSVNGKYKKYYGENKGWISWLSNDYYRNKPSSHRSNQYAGCFADPEDINYAYTNGAIWQAISGNSSCYKCPTMCKECRKKFNGRDMAWSYAMNGAFRYDTSHGSQTTDLAGSGKTMGSMRRADRTLLFAEINLDDLQGGGNGDFSADSVLEYNSGSGGSNRERIGFNHTLKKSKCAHVTFADCHVERLTEPKGGDLYELTKWLCQGYDITYQNGEYQRDEQSVEDED